MPSPTTRIRELLADAELALGEACQSGRIKMSIPVSDSDHDERINKFLRLAPALCDVADAARKTKGCRLARYHALGSTYTWHDSVLVEIDQALDALDRAAEEASDG